jgi:hypothetical protein
MSTKSREALFKIRAEGAREKAFKSVPVLLRPGLPAAFATTCQP